MLWPVMTYAITAALPGRLEMAAEAVARDEEATRSTAVEEAFSTGRRDVARLVVDAVQQAQESAASADLTAEQHQVVTHLLEQAVAAAGELRDLDQADVS